MNLFAHQEQGVAFLAARKRALLADEQGLGKTATAIVAAERVGGTLIVLCPTSVTHNWAREIRRWASTRDVAILRDGKARVPAGATAVIVPHGLVSRPAILQQLQTLAGTAVCVFDEAHAAKNPKALRTRAIYGQLAPRCAYFWALTGTPTPNNPSELWSSLAALAPERIRRGGRVATFFQFRDAYCQTQQVPGAPRGAVRIVGARNLDDLRKRLDGWMLRRTKAQCLDLPPRRWATVTLTAAAADLAALEATIPGLAAASPEEAMRILRDHPSYSTYRRLCGVAKAKAAAELLAEELDADPEHRVVVFAHHREVVQLLCAELSRFGLVSVTGDSSAGARQAAVDTFQARKARVAVCQIVAGGVGITLTAAHDVVLVEQSWTPGENAQAADRCHRIGQDQPVLVRCVALAQSVDERIAEVLAVKSAMIAGVVGAA